MRRQKGKILISCFLGATIFISGTTTFALAKKQEKLTTYPMKTSNVQLSQELELDSNITQFFNQYLFYNEVDLQVFINDVYRSIDYRDDLVFTYQASHPDGLKYYITTPKRPTFSSDECYAVLNIQTKRQYQSENRLDTTRDQVLVTYDEMQDQLDANHTLVLYADVYHCSTEYGTWKHVDQQIVDHPYDIPHDSVNTAYVVSAVVWLDQNKEEVSRVTFDVMEQTCDNVYNEYISLGNPLYSQDAKQQLKTQLIDMYGDSTQYIIDPQVMSDYDDNGNPIFSSTGVYELLDDIPLSTYCKKYIIKGIKTTENTYLDFNFEDKKNTFEQMLQYDTVKTGYLLQILIYEENGNSLYLKGVQTLTNIEDIEYAFSVLSQLYEDSNYLFEYKMSYQLFDFGSIFVKKL